MTGAETPLFTITTGNLIPIFSFFMQVIIGTAVVMGVYFKLRGDIRESARVNGVIAELLEKHDARIKLLEEGKLTAVETDARLKALEKHEDSLTQIIPLTQRMDGLERAVKEGLDHMRTALSETARKVDDMASLIYRAAVNSAPTRA